MPLVLTAGPEAEPITLSEAKAHLRVDGSAEDPLIGSLILASRLHVERTLGLALITQSWSWFLDAWPRRRALELPLHPIQSIAAVRVYDSQGTPAAVDPGAYTLDATGIPPRLVRQDALAWPTPGRTANGIEVALTAGYGDAAGDVPEPIRHAIRLLVAHWYEHRSPLEVGALAEPPPGMVADLLAPYRAMRL